MIKVYPNTEYYFHCSYSSRFCYYDSNKSYISTEVKSNTVFTTPSNAYWMSFYTGAITTYNNDISINRPSTYTGYHPSALPKEISERKEALNKYMGGGWNQRLPLLSNIGWVSNAGGSVTPNSDGSITVNTNSTDWSGVYTSLEVVVGHKYYFSMDAKTASGNTNMWLGLLGSPVYNGNLTTSKERFATVITAQANGTLSIERSSGNVNQIIASNAMLTDLTAMGLDSITTVAQFRSLYSADYYPWWPIGGQHSNRNLLDNPWFTVNQRGVSTIDFRNTPIYCYDRWMGYDCILNESNKTVYTVGQNYGYGSINQRIEEDMRGKLVTVSYKYKGSIYSASLVVSTNDFNTSYATSSDGNVWINLSYSTETNHTLLRIRFKPTTTETYNMPDAVKLELGTVSTLHMDTAPNYAEELLKCRRYYFNGFVTTAMVAYTGGYTTGFQFPVEMRTQPSVTITSFIRMLPFADHSASVYTIDGVFGVRTISCPSAESGNIYGRIGYTASADL